MYSDSTKHYIGQGTFAFAISVTDNNLDISESFEEYIELELYLISGNINE